MQALIDLEIITHETLQFLFMARLVLIGIAQIIEISDDE
jgi:hypothetical protein